MEPFYGRVTQPFDTHYSPSRKDGAMPDIRALVAEILEQPIESIALDADLEELGWDSLADLSLIAIADERYGVAIDPQALADSETPADLAELLTSLAA